MPNKNAAIKVEPVALIPTPVGCAMFLGDGEKVILIYIDPAIGASINDHLSGVEPPRPMTHDLIANMIEGIGGRMSGAYVVKEEDEVFFATIVITVENEVQEKRILQLDCRPSDCIALAVRMDVPVYFLKEVWEKQADMGHLLEELKRHSEEQSEE